VSSRIPAKARQPGSMGLASGLPATQLRIQAAETHMQRIRTLNTTDPSVQAQGTQTEGPLGPLRSLDVAVIGAGAAGLVVARELLREGHRVVVYEQDPGLGGVWRYDPEQEEDPLGVSEQRRVSGGVHSSMYSSLRTNLPRELMSFTDFPFSYPLPTDRDNPGTPHSWYTSTLPTGVPCSPWYASRE